MFKKFELELKTREIMSSENTKTFMKSSLLIEQMSKFPLRLRKIM